MCRDSGGLVVFVVFFFFVSSAAAGDRADPVDPVDPADPAVSGQTVRGSGIDLWCPVRAVCCLLSQMRIDDSSY